MCQERSRRGDEQHMVVIRRDHTADGDEPIRTRLVFNQSASATPSNSLQH
jgi:hypothetical protein